MSALEKTFHSISKTLDLLLVQEKLWDSSSKKHKYLYKLSWQSIKYLLIYFSLGQSGEPTGWHYHPKSRAARMANKEEDGFRHQSIWFHLLKVCLKFFVPDTAEVSEHFCWILFNSQKLLFTVIPICHQEHNNIGSSNFRCAPGPNRERAVQACFNWELREWIKVTKDAPRLWQTLQTSTGRER